MKNLCLLILCLSIGACQSSFPVEHTPTPTYIEQTPTPIYNDLIITMERDACFGTCPVYKLTIYGDGKVVYEGKRFVAVEGIQNAKINPEQIQELVNAFENADYFSLEDSYAASVTDMPSATTSITINGRSKSIWHYGMMNCKGSDQYDIAPKELCELEIKIDEIVNSKQWVSDQK